MDGATKLFNHCNCSFSEKGDHPEFSAIIGYFLGEENDNPLFRVVTGQSLVEVYCKFTTMSN